MPAYQHTRLWTNTLAPRPGDPYEQPRTRLRDAYARFRERAALLAGEIARSLPDFTVHGIEHIDALWETAELVMPPGHTLTPLEAFVLGGAFLVHDLGLGLAAYPGGEEQIAREPLWMSEVARILRRETGRYARPSALAQVPAEVRTRATAAVLRELHADHAVRVVMQGWESGGTRWHLVDDPELREGLGPLIGRIAASHWWNASRLRGEFGERVGAPAAFPREWSIDPLRLAALVRVADAAQLDARRAPGFLLAIRNPSPDSRPHWVFQQHLHRPRLEGDNLVFTSAHPFPVAEADAWWLCLDHLRQLDRELHDVDRLLDESGRPRLAARTVRGVTDPDRLAALVRTDGWLPVDARVRVGDAVSLVRRLGGEQLYGDDPSVVLRELVQNASDAVRARRLVERRPPDWGDIRIRTGGVDGDEWLEVEDNGLGMSKEVLTGPLLDFGQSYWGSQLMVREHPTLLGTGFEPTGRFGIGFFSVFMVARRVTVATRRFDAAQSETFVLEFANGLESRPIVRPADPAERLIDGGTRVRVWLDRPVAELTVPLSRFWNSIWSDVLSVHDAGMEVRGRSIPESKVFERFCAWLFPSLEVNLHVREHENPETTVIAAFDWLRISPPALLLRLLGLDEPWDDTMADMLKRADTFMRVVRTDASVAGRAYMQPPTPITQVSTTERCVLTTGGIRIGTVSGAVGIMNGAVGTAARNTARLAVDEAALASWSEEQGRIAAWQIDDPTVLSRYAACVAAFGGDPRSLPIAEYRGRWVSGNEIRGWHDPAAAYLLVSAASKPGVTTEVVPAQMPEEYGEVFVLNTSWLEFTLTFGKSGYGPRRTRFKLVIEALADLWGATPKAVLDAMDRISMPREIGTRDGVPVVAATVVLRNPNARDSAEDFPW
jgi:hypothetical protein